MIEEETKCYLLDNKLIVAPHDPGEPPSWVPTFLGCKIVWVCRELFDQLKARMYDKSCDVCPDEIKEKCNESNG